MLLVNRPIPTGILPALYGFSHILHPSINLIMKLRLSLLLYFLLGIGMFSHAQDKPQAPARPPKVENGPDAIPVVVKSHKKGWKVPPPPAPPKVAVMAKPGAPKHLKNSAPTPPPPLAHPRKPKGEKPPKPDAPPLPDGKTR